MSREERIAELRRARGVAKRQLTAVEKFVSEINSETDIYVVEARFESLDGIRQHFEQSQLELERIDDAESAEPADGQLTERETFENRFIQIKARMQRCRRESHNSSSLFNPPHNSTIIDLETGLPKIDLPDFHGEYSNFPTFLDLFDTLVHNNPSRQLSNVRKLSMLLNACKGKAFDVIKHLRLTNENYEAARTLLCDRFLNNRLNFEECIRKMWEVPKATSARTLRTLFDDMTSQLKALEHLGTKEQVVDGILIYLVLGKIDSTSRSKWEEHQASSKNIPVWSDFAKYLEKRCTVWEAMESAKPSPRNESYPTKSRTPDQVKRTYIAQNTTKICICDGNCRNILECSKFKNLAPKRKFMQAKELGLCYCCLNPRHETSCEAPKCVHCNRLHHSSLHFGKFNRKIQMHSVPMNISSPLSSLNSPPNGNSTPQSTLAVAVKTFQSDCSNVNKSASVDFNKNYCFLATAIILVKNSMNEYVPLRALFDGAAQCSFITSKAARLLCLPTINTNLELSGVHGSRRTLRKALKAEFKSAFSEFSGEFYLPINPHYNDTHPVKNFDVHNWSIPQNIQLADPSFNVAAHVDILLNAHISYEWQSVGQIRLGDGLPLLQKTLLGWVVVGQYDHVIGSPRTHLINITLSGQLEELVARFWEVERINNEHCTLTPEEIACEAHYVSNVKRKPDGRFVVKLPFKVNPECLGESRTLAKGRFDSLLRKLTKNPALESQYVEFIEEYKALGHCQHVTENSPGYVIPHFHVLNPASTTTKLRVVFDASAHTSNGLCLNDALMVGPTIQRELFAHLMTFRSKAIALTGDISKMYRQVEVAPEDRKWQQILWVSKNNHVINLELNTVTYGTAPASFLATRVLKSLADEEKVMLAGAHAIRENMYVDDLLCGTDDVEDAIKLFEEVTSILSKGQLPIRKFCSNSPEVMAAIPSQLHGTSVQIGEKDVIKALGTFWSFASDEIGFLHQDLHKPLTKRGITSELSSLFDIMGLVSPVIVLGKIIIQKLWTLKVDWDESLPKAEVTSWLKLREELRHIDKITFPRYVLPCGNIKIISLHGFGDASKLAYAAVLYVRSEDDLGNVCVRILCSKTRVAPLKTLTLPRLELLSGQLLAELYSKVKPLLPFPITGSFLWLDASIALTWIKASPHRWTPFVATRVAKIQELTNGCQWRHVQTENNPADIASRGMVPSKLAESSLWKYGPEFLRMPMEQWPNRFCQPQSLPEMAPLAKVLVVSHAAPDLVTQAKYQSWTSLKVTFGYVNRFISQLKSKVHQRRTNAPPSSIIRQKTIECTPKPSGVGCPSSGQLPSLNALELEAGLTTIVKIVQQHHFGDIIKALVAKVPFPKGQKEIIKLKPFLDNKGLIRVGGRLTHSIDLSYATKYPYLIPAHHVITRSLFLHVHAKFMHAGPRTMMNVVYQKFWPLRGKVVANSVYTRCLRCQWVNPKPLTQLMGDLPGARVSVTERAFVRTGVDYFEPLYIAQPGRGRKPLRAYVCLFICMNTKAVHLELVDDLTTPGFINAFSRFTARRGMPSEMFSDNGRNFVGARNLLYDNQERYNNKDHWQAVFDWCKAEGIVWHFTPPRTPHQGGLWEAAVKSAKYHLIRSLGQTSLYRAEMETVLCSVEAILNSRPLIPVASNPVDDMPLTPGHFLIGGPMKTLPEPHLTDYKLGNLERYKRLCAIKQSFWQKWSREYLNTLMNRYKWSEEQPNLQVGDYVLLVDKTSKPLSWSWGKVVEVKAAKDGKIRIVKVKTKDSVYERGITELCRLPFEESTAIA